MRVPHTICKYTKEDRCLLLPATSRECCCLLLLGVIFVGLVGEVRSFCRHTNIASNNRGVSADYAAQKLQKYSRRSPS